MYEYYAKLIRVVDGDTVKLEVDLGFNCLIRETFRLADLDTYEMNDKDPTLRDLAKKEKAQLDYLLRYKLIRVRTDKTGKYGRWIARLFTQGYSEDSIVDVNRTMFEFHESLKDSPPAPIYS